VCISDTHRLRAEVPEGDLLIHAGDLTDKGTIAELQEQIDWLDALPHAHKIAIAGNHDTFLDPRARSTLSAAGCSGRLDWRNIHYLQHRSVIITFPERDDRKLTIYGAPQIPACGGPEHAFQYPRDQDAWTDTVPAGTDVLVTHTPPRFHLDLPIGLGCEWLLRESWRVRPKLHVFGHVHAGSGQQGIWWDGCQAAYERICQRKAGLLDLLNPGHWTDLALLFICGIQSAVWSVLWGGEARGGTLVNAALMSQETGMLDNIPQVVML